MPKKIFFFFFLLFIHVLALDQAIAIIKSLWQVVHWRIQGGCHQCVPPNKIQFFHFCICFCQKAPTLEVSTPPNSSAPPNRKSWICHCSTCTNYNQVVLLYTHVVLRSTSKCLTNLIFLWYIACYYISNYAIKTFIQSKPSIASTSSKQGDTNPHRSSP